ncbi:retrovirus-related pol polyprotein from transposon TNT 1-94 [Tanacetum coccineum]
MGALATLQEGNKCSEETKAKDDVFLHQHIDEMLEFEYSNCDDPSILWKDLETRFNNQREVLLPSARDEWNNLRFQDFKKVNEYTSALFRICRTLRFCGQTITEADMLEKTFSTFHASNLNLQQQYRLQNFKRYSDLNVNLLVAEENNELYQTFTLTSSSPKYFTLHRKNNKNDKIERVLRLRGLAHVDVETLIKFKMSLNDAQYQAKDGELCIADSGATHSILKSKKYFFELKPTKGTIDTTSGPTNLIDGVGKANVVLPNGTQLLIENALFSLKSKRNLLSFRNIYHNGYDTRSRTIGNKKYLNIINENQIFEKLPMLHSGLHYTHINVSQAHMAVKEKYSDPGIFSLWHDRLGHLRSTMMKRIIKNTHGRPLKDQKFPKIDKVPLCTSCSLGKLIARPLPLKVENESPMFLERIQVYVPIAPPQRTKMGPQMRLGIYVGYETSSIIRYIEPLIGDQFTARFADCHFDEVVFLKLGGVKKNQEKHVTWCEPSLLYLDPRTKQCETEVQNIAHLKEIANQLPNAFTDTKRVTKSYIPTANAPAQVEIPNKQAGDNIAQESQKRLKRGRPIGSKDKNPRKRKGTEKNSCHDENVLDETQISKPHLRKK